MSSGDYIFPPKEFDEGEPLDPDELNRVLQPPANMLAGGLGTHNIDENISASVTVEEAAYHAITHDWEARDTDIASSPYHPTQAGTGTGSVADVPADLEWHVVDDLTRTITTDTDVLWVVGWVQFSADKNANYEAHIQIAIRIDGVVIPGTKTGHDQDTIHFGEPWKMPNAKAGPGAAGSYSTRPAYFKKVSSIQQPTGAVRTMVAWPVLPGSHVVEIVARRSWRAEISDPADWLSIYNRQMMICKLVGGATPSFTASLHSIPSFTDQDTLDTAALLTNRLAVLQTQINQLPESSVAKGALISNHLPTKVLGSDEQSLAPASPTAYYTNIWPGWASINDFTGSPGWAKLLTSNNGGAGWDQSISSASDIIIIANVEIADISIAGSYALACLYYTLGGTDYAIPGSIAMVGASAASTPLSFEERYDLPLVWVLSSSAGGSDYTEIGVAVSSRVVSTMTTQRASLQIIHLKR